MAALSLPNIGLNQKSNAIVIFGAVRHIFDIPKCDTHSEPGAFFVWIADVSPDEGASIIASLSRRLRMELTC